MADVAQLVRAGDPVAMAGEMLANALKGQMYESELVRLAIPGGSALAALGPARERLGDAWSHVQLTWVDERCVALDDDDSNRGAAERAGWLGGDGGPAPRHVVPLFADGEEPSGAAARASDELAAVFGSALDVTLLGMGPDGHVASLFPGAFDRSATTTVRHVADSPKPPADRMTLTWPFLATAHTTFVLATGESKREALERTAAGDPEMPATGLHGLVLISDLDVAGS